MRPEPAPPGLAGLFPTKPQGMFQMNRHVGLVAERNTSIIRNMILWLDPLFL
jgi:hypothetical protein